MSRHSPVYRRRPGRSADDCLPTVVDPATPTLVTVMVFVIFLMLMGHDATAALGVVAAVGLFAADLARRLAESPLFSRALPCGRPRMMWSS